MVVKVGWGLLASHALAVTKETDYQPIDYKEAFRLATFGGSKGRLEASILDPQWLVYMLFGVKGN